MFTHSANFIVLTVAFVRHKMSLVRLFFAPCLLHLGEIAPPLPPSPGALVKIFMKNGKKCYKADFFRIVT